MYKHILILAVLAISLQTTQAQMGRFVDSFDKVVLTGDIKVTLQAGEEEKVEITTSGIDEDDINVKVNRMTLRVGTVSSLLRDDETVDITITYKKLRGITAQAGCLVECTNTLEGDKYFFDISSGADAKFDVRANAIDVVVSEGGMLILSGVVESQEVKALTGGEYEGFDLECNNTYVKANTGGQAEVVANQSLEASANTGGDIAYRGNPEKKETSTFLAGEIRSND